MVRKSVVNEYNIVSRRWPLASYLPLLSQHGSLREGEVNLDWASSVNIMTLAAGGRRVEVASL